jgi:hypothetical protein
MSTHADRVGIQSLFSFRLKGAFIKINEKKKKLHVQDNAIACLILIS